MTIVRTLLAGLLASGCASLDHFDSGPDGARLMALSAAPAPAGAQALCARAPRECAAETPAEAPDPLALFRSLAQHEAAPAIAAPRQPARARLDGARARLLGEVNRMVNARIDPASDEEVYGQPDYWTAPTLRAGDSSQEGAKGAVRGDCEDYALAKRAILIAQGWPVEALSIAVAMGARGLHVALVAHTDSGDLVLDSEAARPLRLQETRYTWLMMQTGADLGAWRTVRVQRQSVV
ncbi:MAG: transglutaminase-like cysteine peptidase [Hyphomonadaceae bacterium]|nr:transglutaminase-like cysteine peptidase [Hyphomonadaceae bacterium]